MGAGGLMAGAYKRSAHVVALEMHGICLDVRACMCVCACVVILQREKVKQLRYVHL